MKNLTVHSWRKSKWSFVGWTINNEKILSIDKFFCDYNWFKYIISTTIFIDKKDKILNLWCDELSDYIINKICNKLDKLENVN